MGLCTQTPGGDGALLSDTGQDGALGSDKPEVGLRLRHLEEMQLCAALSGRGSELSEEARGGALSCDRKLGRGSALRMQRAGLCAQTRVGSVALDWDKRCGAPHHKQESDWEVGCALGFSYLTVFGVSECWLDKRPGQWPARRTVAGAKAEPRAQEALCPVTHRLWC